MKDMKMLLCYFQGCFWDSEVRTDAGKPWPPQWLLTSKPFLVGTDAPINFHWCFFLSTNQFFLKYCKNMLLKQHVCKCLHESSPPFKMDSKTERGNVDRLVCRKFSARRKAEEDSIDSSSGKLNRYPSWAVMFAVGKRIKWKNVCFLFTIMEK